MVTELPGPLGIFSWSTLMTGESEGISWVISSTGEV